MPAIAAATPAAAFAMPELKPDSLDCACFMPFSNCAVSAPRTTRRAPITAPLAISFQASKRGRDRAQYRLLLSRRLPFAASWLDEQILERLELLLALQSGNVPSQPGALVVLALPALAHRVEHQAHIARCD